MKEYIINSGEFNILVRPTEQRYYILGRDETSRRAIKAFLGNEPVDLSGLEAGWFKYRSDERWHDFSGAALTLNADLSEEELIDRFVQKRFNFGGLVAERESDTAQAKIFKRHKLLPEQA